MLKIELFQERREKITGFKWTGDRKKKQRKDENWTKTRNKELQLACGPQTEKTY